MRRSSSALVVVVALVVTCIASAAMADLRLPAVIADGMVLQHGRPVPVWGWAEPGETVSVTLAEHAASTEANRGGRWSVTLPKLAAAGDPLEMHISASSGSRIVVKSVLVGEVWFCTGPSNIFWPVKRCDNAAEEMAAADYPKIRFFTVQRNTADAPQADCRGEWFECRPDTVGDVSGIGYFFSRRLHNDLNLPVGMLQSFWGGSRIEAWTSIEALQADPELKPILDWWAAEFTRFDSGKPRPPENPHQSRHRPACLYNGMVAPLIPYGIRGVISYQGLGNLFWAPYNRVLLATMIGDWRSRWQQGPFPFGMVQPAPFPCDRWPKSGPDAYSVQREAQLLVLDPVPNTGVAPTMDIGDIEELHFTGKQEVGRRMALWALATVYGRRIPYSGPVYKSMAVEGSAIRIHFTHTGAGLTTADGQPPSHFTIAGADKVFHPAVAAIDRHTVVVKSEQVSEPVAVRFAFSDVAVPNLINKEGLPASLFRTDAPH